MTTTQQTTLSRRLAQQLRGELITPGDAAYDEARRVWNGMFDRCPAAIARVQGAADVVAVVDFARETGIELAVRGGGHSSAGYSTVDGGIVLDFSRMRGVAVDPAAKVARAAGGRAVGRRRSRDAGARARRAGRPDLAHGHRGADARRWHRLALAPARPDDRQPAVGRSRHRRRAARHRLGGREPRAVLGPARRLRQLRRRRLVRVPPARGRPARARRPAPVRPRRRGGRAAQRTRLLRRRARRGLALARAHPRAAGAAVPGGALGHAGARASSRSAPTSSAGRRCSSRSPRSALRSRACTGRSRTPRCSRRSTTSTRTGTATGSAATTSPGCPTASSTRSSRARATV